MSGAYDSAHRLQQLRRQVAGGGANAQDVGADA